MTKNKFPQQLVIISAFLVLSTISCTGSGPQTVTESNKPASTASPATPVSTVAATATPSSAIPAPTVGATVAPSPASTAATSTPGTLTIADIQPIIKNRCSSCHGGTAGVFFDTEAQIRAKLSRIKQKAVIDKSMPKGNATNMTDEERKMIGQWIDNGAP